jgi:beta-lactamase class A
MLALLLLFAYAGTPPLAGQFEALAVPAQGKVGAAAVLVETGEAVSIEGNTRFPMQSVYKFPIGMAILHQVDRGALRLDLSVTVSPADFVPTGVYSGIRDRFPKGVTMHLRDLLRFMISDSDGTASDVLLRMAGGPAAVTEYLQALGIHGIAVATSEKEMAQGPMVQYRNWATPLAMTSLLVKFQGGAGLSSASRALLMQWMTGSPTGPRRLKGLLPTGTPVAHKTGTSGTSNGLTRATNDSGLITLPDGRHLAISVFVSDSTAPEATREGVIAKIARAAWNHWTEDNRIEK